MPFESHANTKCQQFRAEGPLFVWIELICSPDKPWSLPQLRSMSFALLFYFFFFCFFEEIIKPNTILWYVFVKGISIKLFKKKKKEEKANYMLCWHRTGIFALIGIGKIAVWKAANGSCYAVCRILAQDQRCHSRLGWIRVASDATGQSKSGSVHNEALNTSILFWYRVPFFLKWSGALYTWEVAIFVLWTGPIIKRVFAIENACKNYCPSCTFPIKKFLFFWNIK